MRQHNPLLVLSSLTIACLATLVARASPAGPPVTRDYRLPADSGVTSVKDFGATGDGVTDDTAAIRRAIAAGLGTNSRYGAPPFVYFPAGTYLVSGPLESKVADHGWFGGWRSGMLLLGESRERTVIRLRDDAPGYGEASGPKPVIITGSESDHRTEPGDNPLDGGGNRAFRQSVINLTVDVGRGNPGAIGIDYVANNRGTIQSVTIRSSDPRRAGHTGIALTRRWPGPCLIKNVLIEGFDRGIEAGHFQYGVTFEDVTLRDQREVGVLNRQNVLAFHRLDSRNAVPVIRGTSNHGLILVVDGQFIGSGDGPAIEGDAELYLRDIDVRGYAALLNVTRAGAEAMPVGEDGKIAFYTTEAIGLGVSDPEPMRLPIKDTPTYWSTDLGQWVSPQRFLPDGQSEPDDWADAVQAAMDSGRPIVYFPNGSYRVGRTITVPPSVRLIVGMQSAISVGKENRDKIDPILRFTGQGGASTTVEHMSILGHVEHDALRAIAFRHADVSGRYQNTANGTGDLFTEDTMGLKPLLIKHPQDVWCRQLNLEFGDNPLIENHGGSLWVLLFKTEGQMVCLKQTAGRTEMLGALLYTLRRVTDGTPAFDIAGGRAALTYAMNGPGYPNEVSLETRGGGLTLEHRDTRGRTTGLVDADADDAESQ